MSFSDYSLSMIALFVQTELLCSSFRKLPTNGANLYLKVALFGTTMVSYISIVRYVYMIIYHRV